MRIAIYAPVFVRPTETFILDASIGLATSGHEVHVITARAELEDATHFASVRSVRPPKRWSPDYLAKRLLRPVLGSPHDSERILVHRDRLKHVVAKIEPDVILANYGQGGALVGPVARELDVPLLVSFHGADASRSAKNPKWHRRYQEMFETAAIVTGPSEYVRQRLIALGCPPERAQVLHYGIRTDASGRCPPSRRYNGNDIRFLFVGRLTAKKDPLTLLRSFRSTCDQLSPDVCKLIMIGDGPMRQEVEALISDLNLAKSVEIRGHQPHEEVFRCFQDAHIYVQHSVTAANGDQEGLPVSITEAMAAGLPVIATRHSGIPEAVHEDVTGLLVDEGDEKGMADCMVSLASDPQRWDRYGAAGRSLLEKEFSIAVVQKRLQALLNHAARAARSN